jgi:integrase
VCGWRRRVVTVDEWVAEFARSSTGRSADTLAHTLGMVRGFQVAFERTELSDVSRLDVRRWCAEHPSSARYVRVLFAEAVRAGLVAENPFARPGTRAKAKMDRRPPSEAELLQIMGEAVPSFREFICVAAYTGLRLSELAAVRREDVEQVPKLRIIVRRGKGGREGDRVCVFGPARDVVRDLCDRRVGHLLWTRTGRLWNRHNVGAEWRSVRGEFAGSFHTLRHMHATWLAERGASYQDIATQLRHFDKHGRPNIELIARVYGQPDPGVALDRLEALA